VYNHLLSSRPSETLISPWGKNHTYRLAELVTNEEVTREKEEGRVDDCQLTEETLKCQITHHNLNDAIHSMKTSVRLLHPFSPNDTSWRKTETFVYKTQFGGNYSFFLFRKLGATLSKKTFYVRHKSPRFSQKVLSLLFPPPLAPVVHPVEHRTSVKRFVSLQFLNPKTVGRTPWPGDQPVARPVPTKDNINTE
jgi:hypothetical protein